MEQHPLIIIYYPEQYTGSTFSGVVSHAENGQIVLTYTTGNKVETFSGRFEAACLGENQNLIDKSNPVNPNPAAQRTPCDAVKIERN
jgi:hypothetical protein